MPELWSVQWSASDAGYRVVVCNRCRIVRKFEAETLSGEPLSEIRMRAAAKAVELALEYRVPLEAVSEDSNCT